MAQKKAIHLNNARFGITHTKDNPAKIGVALEAQGIIRCNSGDDNCNNQVYMLSKASKDFTQCVMKEFSISKPLRSQKCQSLFNALESIERDITIVKQMNIHCNDLSLDVKLLDNNSAEQPQQS